MAGVESTRSRRMQTVWFWLTVGVSVGLHGIFLWLPLPPEEPLVATPEVDAIALLQLPLVVDSEPTPTPDRAIAPPFAPVAQTAPIPTAPSSSTPHPVRTAATVATGRDHTTASMPSPASVPPEQTAPTSAPISETPLDAAFPHYAGAESGCHGSASCHQVNGGNLRNVQRYLLDNLTAQGYTLTPQEDLTDTGVRIYALHHPDQPPRYLSILSDHADQDRVYYVIRENAITSLEALRGLTA